MQTLALVRNLNPAKVLVIDDWNSGHPPVFANYPDATVAKLGPDHRLAKWDAKNFMKGLDVVLSVETCYSPEFYDWARQLKVRTVVQGNPEFVRPYERPDVWWWPTTWREGRVPEGRLVPVPCPDHDFTAGAIGIDALNVVHVAGKRAMKDRNGTESLLASIGHVGAPVRYSVFSQDPLPALWERAAARFSVKLPKPPADRFEMYAGQHVLVSPRRYGGLHLPALEAMSRGVVVAMTDCPPNRDWPVVPIQAARGRSIETPGGLVEMYACSGGAIAMTLRGLAKTDRLERAREETIDWAKRNTWDELRGLYEEELERV